MKPVFACLLLLLSGAAVAQSPAGVGAKPSSRAAIAGVVTKDPGGEVVKKAVIELIAENQAEGGNYTAVTGADGTFRIEGVAVGRYRLFVERTGLREVGKHGGRVDGRVLSLATGQELKDLHIRLQAAAVVRGRVLDEDGDPFPDAQVAVLRQTFVSGRGRWEQAGGERTNDLGEYRIAGLPAGTYYVSVTPPPDFKSLLDAAGGERNASASDKAAATTYQTTYYPGTADRGQAAPIQLHAGDDFPVDFALTPSASLSIRGSVVNLPPGSSAAIMLQSRDFNLVLNGAEMHKDGSFVIRDVSPGAYTILATVEDTAVPMMARQSLQVGNSVEGLRLAPQPGAWVHGRVRVEGRAVGRSDANQIYLMLRSTDGDDSIGGFAMGAGFSNLARVAADGSFEWRSVPPGSYFVQIAGDGGGNGDLFVKAALAGGRDAEESGVSVNGGAIVLDLVASASGSKVEGVVNDHNGAPVADAVIVAVPELPLRGREDRYHKTVSDQRGRFTLQGIPPGQYTLFAWESVEGEAYYNPEFLKSYERRGIALRLGEGERQSVQLESIEEEEPEP